MLRWHFVARSRSARRDQARHGPATRTPQRREHRRAEHDDRHGRGDRAAGVEAAGRGQQRVDREPVQVLHQRGARRRSPASPRGRAPRCRGRTASRRGSSAGRRRTPHTTPYAASITISRAAGDPARQQPGAHPDPRRARASGRAATARRRRSAAPRRTATCSPARTRTPARTPGPPRISRKNTSSTPAGAGRRGRAAPRCRR